MPIFSQGEQAIFCFCFEFKTKLRKIWKTVLANIKSEFIKN